MIVTGIVAMKADIYLRNSKEKLEDALVEIHIEKKVHIHIHMQ